MAFVVAAIWKAKEGEEKRVEETIIKMTPLSRAEEGNLYYQAQVSPTDPAHLLPLRAVRRRGRLRGAQGDADYFQENVFDYIIEYLEERSVKTYETIDV